MVVVCCVVAEQERGNVVVINSSNSNTAGVLGCSWVCRLAQELTLWPVGVYKVASKPMLFTACF